ncbi:MAG TPA: hypothetical protein VK047_11825 [Zeimonas sp.]|jgi:hypothetical protein|nr:hypothetical protein [Zeimonas sp.]
MNSLLAMRRQTRMPASAFLVALLALAACQPSYNWREIREADAGYRVMLPSRPVSMQRPIDLDGVPVTMSMTGARVDEAMFTVGSVVLPRDDERARSHATNAMRMGMQRNLQGHETTRAQIEVPVIDAAGKTVDRASGTRVEIEGQVSGKPAHMSATFVARGNRAWQVVMISPDADPQSAKLFHESFRIAQ